MRQNLVSNFSVEVGDSCNMLSQKCLGAAKSP